MRDPKRIPIMLKTLAKAWKKNPDLRLTQLLGNCFNPEDLYHKEDDVVLYKLKNIYLKEEKDV